MVKTKKKKKCTLIDVAIPSDKNNTFTKISEKNFPSIKIWKSNYQNVQTKTEIIPVVVGALGG